MIYITSDSQLDKIIRDTLIEQSALDPKFVRAERSLYGTDLTKNRGDVFDSLVHSDSIVLFEVSATGHIHNISETQSDGLKHFSYFETHIIIYGNEAFNLANKLTARLRSENVRDDLLSKGVQMVTVGSPTEVKEFKNGTIWMRSDFDFTLACTMLIEELIDPNKAESISEIQIQNY